MTLKWIEGTINEDGTSGFCFLKPVIMKAGDKRIFEICMTTYDDGRTRMFYRDRTPRVRQHRPVIGFCGGDLKSVDGSTMNVVNCEGGRIIISKVDRPVRGALVFLRKNGTLYTMSKVKT